MASGVFVTGTGTEVGKTVVAGALARTAADGGARVGVFKPAVSGLDEIAREGGVPDHEHLRMAAGSRQADDEIAPYRFGPAVSPHLAAAETGAQIERDVLLARFTAAGADCEFLVCEGVGGFLVPLAPDYLIRDFAKDAALPLVVVASPGLGTINHTLLTLDAVRACGLEVRCVVLNPWPVEPDSMHHSNRDTILELGEVEVQTLPPLDLADPHSWPKLRA